MLVRLAYLSVVNVFAVLRLLPGSDRDKDGEILALRHQLAAAQRQLGGQKIRFQPADRALLAALLGHLPRPQLRGLTLLVRPGHDPALAPRPGRPPPRHGIPPTPAWSTTHGPLGPGPGATACPGKPHLGPPAHPRRTRRPGRNRRSVDGLGDPPRGRHRRCPRSGPPRGRTSCAPRPTRCSPPTSSRP
jgi:hypothetical protein